MGEEDITNLSKSQKDVIYKEMLEPLNLKISQILLYDTNTALQFLQEYNRIIENEEQSCNALIQSIVELEVNISKYENSEGKEKIFKAQSKAILHSIEDLMRNSSGLSIQEFEGKFASLKFNYDKERGNYSFEDRNEIERKLYELQSSLIMRQVASGKTAEYLAKTISDKDKKGLNIFVMQQINSLQQQEGLRNIATKVSDMVLNDTDAVLNPKLWSWLNVAQRGIQREEQSQNTISSATSTALIVPTTPNKISVWERFKKVFSKEPTFPLQISDLKKISMEWLSDYIPKSMLESSERWRLRKEVVNGKRELPGIAEISEISEISEIYMPDPKKVIINMIAGKAQMNSWSICYQLFEQNGGMIEITVSKDYLIMSTGDYEARGKTTDSNDKFIRPNEALGYAEWLDRIFGTKFRQQLLQELKEVYIEKKHTKDPIRRNLLMSLDNMRKEYKRIEVEFNVSEETRREKFYKDAEE